MQKVIIIFFSILAVEAANRQSIHSLNKNDSIKVRYRYL